MQRPLPVLTIRGRRIFIEDTRENLISILVGLGVVEDRRSQMRHGLKDDRMAIGAEIALASREKPEVTWRTLVK